MRDDYDNPAPAPLPSDGIPILHEIVRPSEDSDIPILDPNDAVPPLVTTAAGNGLSPERIAELTDTLQLTLNRELDYAIDGAVYERLQTAMEEVAASVKKQVQTQLEQKLPDLIEQTLRKEN
jgi:hypothetical protein